MKKFYGIFCFAIVMAMCLFVPTTKAQNDQSNVFFYVGTNSQAKTISLQCQWNRNCSFIELQFSWDTIPNSYRFAGPIPAVVRYDSVGSASFIVSNYSPCTYYYCRVDFRDGSTNINYSLEQTIKTQGYKRPTIKSVNFNSFGYTFAEIAFVINGNCTCFAYEVICGEDGETPIFRTDGNSCGDGDVKVNQTIYGLKSYKNYIVTIHTYNQFGDTTTKWGFTTLSNLLPITEPNSVSTGLSGDGTAWATFNFYLDPQGTQSECRVDYGEYIVMENNTGWNPFFSTGNMSMGVYGLKPATTYYWMPVARNDFGQYRGSVGMFKTPGLTGIEEKIESKFSIYPNPATTVIHATKDLPFIITDIAGKTILSGSELDIDISNFVNGIYFLKNQKGSFMFIKE